MFLYSSGVMPVLLLKRRLKCWGYSNPNRYAISLTDNGVVTNKDFARSIRKEWICCCVFMPVWLRKKSLK